MSSEDLFSIVGQMSGMYKDICTLFNKIFLEQLLDMFCKYFLEKKAINVWLDQ